MFENIPIVDTSPEELDRIANRTTEAAEAFSRKVGKYEVNVIDAAERFRQEADARVGRVNRDDRRIARELAKQDVDSQTSEYRLALVESTLHERQEILDTVNKHEKSLLALAGLFQSPGQMFGRVGLGETRRTNLQLQLEGGGPVELQTAARDAVARRDLVLGAALLTVVSRMKTKERPFSPAELADALMGGRFRDIRAKIDDALERIRAARDLDTQFVRGRANPLSRIERGLAMRKAGGASNE